MVSKLDVLRRMREDPFLPFQIRLNDGSVKEIRDRRQAMITDRSIIIGIPGRDNKPFGVFRDYDLVSLVDVKFLEPLNIGTAERPSEKADVH